MSRSCCDVSDSHGLDARDAYKTQMTRRLVVLGVLLAGREKLECWRVEGEVSEVMFPD